MGRKTTQMTAFKILDTKRNIINFLATRYETLRKNYSSNIVFHWLLLMCFSEIIITVNSYLNFSNRDLRNILIPKDNDDPVPKKGIVVSIRRRLVLQRGAQMPKVYSLSLHGVWSPLTC